MDDLDHETMEAVGYFFLDLAVVPRKWVDQQQEPIKLNPDDYRSPSAVWWREHECELDVRGFCNQRWTRVAPTGYYLREDLTELSWSDDQNHRVEIIENELGSIVEFTVAIDIRTAYSEFIDSIIEMSKRAQAVFFDYEKETVFEPSRDYIIKAIQQHHMNHVVFDSTGKLKLN
jgi:hypothetical protein